MATWLSLATLVAAVAYGLYRLRFPAPGAAPGEAAPSRVAAGSPRARRDRVTEALRRVPPGRVVTFSALATQAGVRELLEVVNAVRGLTARRDVPWWRVVRRTGGAGQVSASRVGETQRRLLEAEGVHFEGRSIPLRRFEWGAGPSPSGRRPQRRSSASR